MNEFNIHKEYNNKEKYLQRLSNFDWINYMLPHEVTKAQIDEISKIRKFHGLYDKLNLNGMIHANRTIQPIFLYSSDHELINSDPFKKTCIKLEMRIREIFSIDSILIDINTFFDLIDNEDGTKNIYKSNNLRAIRYQICANFYNDLIKFFLNLVIDYYYNIETMRISFYTLEECAMKAAEIVLYTKEQFERMIQKDFG